MQTLAECPTTFELVHSENNSDHTYPLHKSPRYITPMAVHTSHCHIVVYAIIFALGLYMAVAAVDVAPEVPVRGRLTLLMAGIAATLIGMLLFWMGCINCSFLRHMWRAFTQRTDTVRQRALLCSNTCVSACL